MRQPTSTEIRPMTTGDWALFFLLSTLFSGTFILAKLALKDFHPFTIVFLRVALAGSVLWMVVWLGGQMGSLSRHDLSKLALMGLLNNAVPFSLIFWGQTQIAASLASILNATMPIFTAILAHFLTRDEKITRLKAVGIALGLAGVAVIFAGPDTLRVGKFWGAIACILAPLSYAAASMVGRRLRHIAPMTAAAGQLSFASLWIAPAMILVDQPWRNEIPSWASIIMVAILAFACTTVPYWIYYRLLRRAGATSVSLTTLVIPIGTVLMGVFFLNEHLLPRHFAGMGLVALALLSIDGRLFRRRI